MGKWYNFKNFTPKNNCYIIVEDHEENIGIGIWIDKTFENQSGFPLGFPVKWMKVIVHCEK